MDLLVSAWMSTLGPVNILNWVVFTLDAAVGTEPWEAITFPTRFLKMERVYPQRPASPPFNICFLILPMREQLGLD